MTSGGRHADANERTGRESETAESWGILLARETSVGLTAAIRRRVRVPSAHCNCRATREDRHFAPAPSNARSISSTSVRASASCPVFVRACQRPAHGKRR